MKVLLLHNRYRLRGGEDVVFEAEAALLRDMGVEVVAEAVENPAEGQGSPLTQIGTAWDSAWSKSSYDWALRLCQRHQPDVVHVHNFWMRLTPSVHAAAHRYGAATVQTLHNFRLLCAGAVFLRDGRICEDCLGGGVWRGVRHKCYRGSLPASLAMARMIARNRARRTWQRDVDAFIVFSEFHRSRFITGGLPHERIHIKPNFTPDPGPAAHSPSASGDVLFVGRMSAEKGPAIAVDAWERNRPAGRLIMVGDGPERAALEARQVPGVEFAGWRSQAEVSQHIRQARTVIVPSTCYEGQSMAVTDAFCAGRPVVASRLGSLEIMVQHGVTGFTAAPANHAAWDSAIHQLTTNPALADRLGANARQRYHEAYTPERNFQLLTEIYQCALRRRATPERAAAMAGGAPC